MRKLASASITALVLAASGGTVAAQDYAIASLIGSQFSVAYTGSVTGTRIPEGIPAVPVTEPVFDEAALESVASVLRRAGPQGKLVRLTISDAAIVESARTAPSPNTRAFNAIVEPLAAAARAHSAARLVLVMPYRDDVMVLTNHHSRGIGKAAGIGAYFDPAVSLGQVRMAHDNGYLGVFANFRIVVIDTQSGRMTATDTVAKGHAYFLSGSPDPYRFDAVPAKDRVAKIVDLVRSGIEERLPTVL
jgi:hypothetical protein